AATLSSGEIDVHNDHRDHPSRSSNVRLRSSLKALCCAGVCGLIPACGGSGQPVPPPAAKAIVKPAAPANEVPTEKLALVLRAHLEGLGRMEQFDYPAAVERFAQGPKLAPGWIPGSINLAIALLNGAGVEIDKAKQGAGAEAASATSGFDRALLLLSGVLEREPSNLHALYCRGLILETLGSDRLKEAYEAFR